MAFSDYPFVTGYWAKTPKNKRPMSSGTSLLWHPLVWHLLDVASVGDTLLKAKPSFLATLRRLSGCNTGDALSRWVCYLLAVHDLGKFFEGFQNSNPEARRAVGKVHGAAPSRVHHSTTASFATWSWSSTQDIIQNHLGCSQSQRRVFHAWLDPVFGHHGSPVTWQGTADDQLQVTEEILHDLDAYLRWLGEHFFPEGGPKIPESNRRQPSHALSWWFAGFVSLCDAIGSTESWFSFEPPDCDPSVYWNEKALPRAQQAIQDLRFRGIELAKTVDFETLWPTRTPTPMQQLVDELALAAGPQLFILEDATGAGKTEAACLLAGRLLAAGRAHGLYFGLPTRATADSLDTRLRKDLKKLLPSPENLNFGRIHQDAKVLNFGELPRDENGSKDSKEKAEPPTVVSLAHWLAEAERKAMLADVGVGTIDQALLAVLPQKFQAMRLLGLADKVLIVDEVHAYDDYTRTLLGRLLQFHAAMDGSAILLSATLPSSHRDVYLTAFQKGLKALHCELRPAAPTATSNDYPLLTVYDGDRTQEVHRKVWDRSARTLSVDFSDDEPACDKVILNALNEGRCVVWIRNTVRDAQRTYRRWQALADEQSWDADRVDLLHSRYSSVDRLRRERRTLKRFGPKSDAAIRQGRLLIATQVVEQSLDLDFDVLITDLAPIDLLLQRAGRLCRHPRRPDGDPKENGADERGMPVLHILAPPFAADPPEDWVRSSLPGTAAVYRRHDQLWLTQRVLRESKDVEMPHESRRLVEAVYGDPPNELREILVRLGQAARLADERSTTRAENRVLSLSAGYSTTSSVSWPKWAPTATRSGEAQARVFLLRRDGDALVPLHAEGKRPSMEEWRSASVLLPEHQIREEREFVPRAALGDTSRKMHRPPGYGYFFVTGDARSLDAKEVPRWEYGEMGLARTADLE